MKIALVGAGGTRAPLFARALARRAPQLAAEVCLALADVDADRLRAVGGLARALADREGGGTLRTTLASSLSEALDGADFVVTSIRAGGDAGRVADERIALAHGVLGQETTGAGGLAMALRSVPALVEIAETAARLAPRAWTLHFTNPAGLVTQVLCDEGHERQLGICDSPADLVRRLAAFLRCEERELDARVVGLNHLSWLASLATPEQSGDEDRLPALLADDRFVAVVGAPFEPALLRGLGLVPGEYLHYYYHRDVVLRAQLARATTRGADIERANAALVRDLVALDPSGRYDACFDAALARYAAYNAERETSYREQIGRAAVDAGPDDASEGYAGVALDVVEALAHDAPATIVLSTRSGGATGPALSLLAEADVLEVSCRVDALGAHPLAPRRELPEEVEVLIAAVKVYERLASRAIRTRDRALAARALAAHPLVGSYPQACALVEAYLAVHAPHVGTGWR